MIKIDLPEASSGGLPEGNYKLRFTDNELVQPNLEKGYKTAVRFVFEVSDGEHKGQKASRICGLSAGPKAELPKFIKSLTKSEPKAGQIDLSPFVGKEYLGTIGKTQSGATRIETIIPLW